MGKVLEFLMMNSIYMALVMAIVLLVRVLMRRAPKVFSYMLWAVVFFRLLCPMSLSSEISIVPDVGSLLGREHTFSNEALNGETVTSELSFAEDSFEYADLSGKTEEYTAESYIQNVQVSEESARTGKSFDAPKAVFMVWLCGSVLVLSWHIISWFMMKKKVRTATLVEDNVYESDRIGTAFVSGIIRPKIYVPCWLESDRYGCIVCHERCHIRRGDHIIKPIASLICCIYWFNPLVWAAMYFMCRDMEQSCDEIVVSSMGSGIKGDYSRMLLDFSLASPMAFEPAFGANNAKKRIKNVLSYRKPKKIVIAMSVIAVVLAAAACTGSNSGKGAEKVENTVVVSETEPENIPVQEEKTETVSTVKEEKEQTVRYNIPELGEPKIVVTTNAEIGSYNNSFSHKADGQIYVDMGDGEIVPYQGAYKVKGDTMKIYCDGDISWITLSKMKLTSVDVSNCPILEILYCNGNDLTSIDISKNQALYEFDCSNNSITSLDLSSNPNLKIVCCDSNKLSELETGDVSMIESLYCSRNSLNSVDISKLENLKYFGCSSNMISELDISKNAALEKLHCYGNRITELDVTNNPALEVLEYDNGVNVLKN